MDRGRWPVHWVQLGSYQPDKAPPAEQAAEIYADIARLHADYVDFHLLETMASVDQARGGLMGAGVTGKPIYVSLSVDDTDGTKLRSGEPLADAIAMLKTFDPAAVLINCSLPEAVSQGLPILAGQGFTLGVKLRHVERCRHRGLPGCNSLVTNILLFLQTFHELTFFSVFSLHRF